MKERTEVHLAGGKYTVIFEGLDDGAGSHFHALRYGEPWRDLNGDKLMLEMLFEIERLKDKIREGKGRTV